MLSHSARPERGMFGDRVWRGAEHGEQPGGRDGLQQIAFAAREHVRQNRARRIHVSHDVDFPGAQPIAIGRAAIALHADAGVGAKQVDVPVFLEDFVDQHLDVGFAGDVDSEIQTANFGCDSASGFGLDIRDDYCLGAFGCKTPAERAADAVSAAGNNDDFVLDSHALMVATSDANKTREARGVTDVQKYISARRIRPALVLVVIIAEHGCGEGKKKRRAGQAPNRRGANRGGFEGCSRTATRSRDIAWPDNATRRWARRRVQAR